MPINNLIQFRKGSSTDWSSQNPILSGGEPGFDLTNNILKVGNGTSSWLDLNPVNLSGTYFNNAVSGLLPVKNIVAGSDISVSSISGIYTISNTMTSVETSASVVTTVFNKTGASIPKMTAVYINGGQGDLPTIQKALATADISSAGTYGITYEAIDNMSSGRVIVLGALTGLNTDQFNPTAPIGNVNGSVVYLSPTVSGALTTTKPYAPYHIVAIGTIVRTHQNEGVIEVRVQNGYELEELHNVAVTGATNGQFLQYNSVSGLWVPSSSGNFTTLQVSGTAVPTGTGSANSITKWTGTNSLNNSIIYDNGSNIGIGTSSPSYKLDVVGTGNFSQNLLVNGTGVSLSGHTHSSSQITDFNSSVSGLLPVKNIVAGTGISISSNNEIYTINLYAVAITGYEILTTAKDTFTVTPNYLVGNLQVYYNGFKLLDGEDYTATNGTSFLLSSPGASGDVVEWAGLGGPAQYAQLNHTHTISDITNFGSGVTGLLPTIANSGNNRVLTSTGSSTGINAESNFTFDGTSLSHHAGNFANAGDAQHTILVARRTTTDSTANVVLTLDGNTPGASNRPTIPAQSVWTFSLKLSAYNDTDSLGAWWIIRGGIRRNGANGTALVGSLVVENDSEGAMSGTSATVVADDTNEALEIRVTGLSSKNIRWAGVLDISQVSYGTP